jgi:FtsP/CotA-like multicopper oxidase with cupredoxin domain
MVIYGPSNAEYDIDVGPLMISDWTHQYYEDVVKSLLAPLPAANIPESDNNLINGKNSFDCSQTTLPCTPNAPLASFNFTSGKTMRLRLINPSAAAVQKITIDNHNFTVIAQDFVPIEPYETDVMTLAVGQRSDVLVKATGDPTDAVWLRAYKPPICWPTHGGDEVKAAIFYEDANRNQQPNSTAGPNAYNTYCGNDPLSETVPYYGITPPDPEVVEVMPLEFKSNGSNLLWYMQNRTFRVNYNSPIYSRAASGNVDFPYIENVHNYGTNNSLLFIIENTGQQPHPMHVHG